MGAHNKPEDPSSSPILTHATYDSRGHLGDAHRVVITKPVRNWFAFFALAGSLVSFVLFMPVLVAIFAISAVLGIAMSKTDVREGRYCSYAALILLVAAIIFHI